MYFLESNLGQAALSALQKVHAACVRGFSVQGILETIVIWSQIKALSLKHHKALLIGVFFMFLLLRLPAAFSFPIFNDEALWIEYSQVIAGDFDTYKFVSMTNRFVSEWKPPLQYWLGSLVVYIGDPLVATRLLSIFISLLGLIGLYLFIRELYDKETALLGAFLYTIAPPVILYNIQFTAETYLFSFAAIAYYFTFRSLREEKVGRAWLFIVRAGLVGACLILTKQSGLLYLEFLPLIAFMKKENATEDQTSKKNILRNVCIVFITIGISLLIYRLIIPASTLLKAAAATSRWTFSLNEIMTLPLEIWTRNIVSIADFFVHAYGIAALALVFVFACNIKKADTRKDQVIGLLFLLSSGIIIFGLRAMSEYYYFAGTVIFMIPLLARGIQLTKTHDSKVLLNAGKAISALLVTTWLFYAVLINTNPGAYLVRQSTWARANYLTEWSGGFGIEKVVGFLKNQKEPAIAFLDAQWGNPATSIKIFQKPYYPHIQLTYLSHRFNPYSPQGKVYTKKYKNRFVIFSDRKEYTGRIWQKEIKRDFCKEKQEIKAHPLQTPLVICSF